MNLVQKTSNVLKIVLFGSESTGKTTLSKKLAKHYNTIWVPEFARYYLQKKWDSTAVICQEEDIMPIAEGQMKLENKMIYNSNKILFCDTNILQTKVYAEQYYKNYFNPKLEKATENSSYNYYFLTDIDVPFKKDDLRDRPHQRQEMLNAFKESLENYNCKYSILRGSIEQRLKKAIGIINKFLTQDNV